jgi:hypothetical protein
MSELNLEKQLKDDINMMIPGLVRIFNTSDCLTQEVFFERLIETIADTIPQKRYNVALANLVERGIIHYESGYVTFTPEK